MAGFDMTDPESEEKMREFMGPNMIDTQIRHAIQFCWMALPKENKTADEMERQIRRIVDRAIADFRDDQAAFKVGL